MVEMLVPVSSMVEMLVHANIIGPVLKYYYRLMEMLKC